MNHGLSNAERAYYARHLTLNEIGVAGQEKLKASSVLLIGLGGLGSPMALYLAAAGVGRIGIFEFDKVETSNLHRQVLFDASQAGKLKLEVGAARLRELNPHIQIETFPQAIDASNARASVAKYDLVADGTDNFQTRYLVNDACVLENKPLVSASILGFEGQLSVFHHEGGPCYRCLYPEPPPEGMAPSCSEAGVLGVLPGVMGTLQATEVLKVFLGIGEVASGRLLCYDALALSFEILNVSRDGNCPVCGDSPIIREVIDRIGACAPVSEISARELFADLQSASPKFLVLDVREDNERRAGKIEPSLHIPLAQILEGKADLPKDQTIVVHCAAGIRSLKAAQYLVAHGHGNIANLTGGMQAWLQLQPVTRR